MYVPYVAAHAGLIGRSLDVGGEEVFEPANPRALHRAWPITHGYDASGT